MDMIELFPRRLTAGADDMRAMVESGSAEFVIDRQAVRNHDCARFDIVLNERINGRPKKKGTGPFSP